MPDTPLLDRMELERSMNYKPSVPPTDLPNIPYKSIQTPMPSIDGDGEKYVSPLNALENSLLSIKGDGKMRGGSIPRSIAESISPRYNMVVPGDYDNEDAHAQGQGWASKMVNGVGKGLVLTGTTLLQSTVGLVNGVLRAAGDGRAASFYDNDFNRQIDEINKKMEDFLPNYYTNVERNAAWYSKDKLFTANFFWDGIIKNMGFAAGAALSGGIMSAGLKALPLTARLFSVGKAAEALAATEEGLLAADKVAETYGKVKSLSDKFLSSYSALNTGGRVLVGGLATTGEAGFEAYNNMNQFRDDRIKEYKEAHDGQEPMGADLAAINAEAENVGNSSFLLNTALLSATNYIQFPKILGSSYKAEKSVINGLTKEIGEITTDATGKYIAKAPTTGFGKILSTLNKVRPYTFSTSEGFEEGAQYAIQVGTQDYYNKKYKGDASAEFLTSAVEGIKQTLGTDEGMQNVLIGGLSGALMMAKGTFTEGREKSENTAQAIAAFNKFKLSDFTKETVDSVNRGVVLQQEREKALKNGDVLESKDKETDYIINYLAPRIKFGRMDLVTSDIQDLRALASSEEGFGQLVGEGKALETDTQQAYLQRLTGLENTANNIKSLYESLNIRYGGMMSKDGKSLLYSPAVMDKMVYAATKIADYDKRVPEVGSKVALAKDIDINTIVEDVADKNFESYDKAMSIIESLDKKLNADQIADLKQSLQDVAELTLRRQKFLQDYNDMKKNPEVYKEQESIAPEDMKVGETIKLKTKAGEINYTIGEEYYLGTVIKGTNEQGFEEVAFPTLTILVDNGDGTIKIKDSSGKVRDIEKSKLEQYKLGKLSSLAKDKKGNFFYNNRNTLFEFNLGKGKKIQGRLEYSQKDGVLLFKYFNKNGKPKFIEVTGDQFVPRKGYNQAMITAVGTITALQQKSLEEYAAEKDARTINKREARLNILNNMFDETSEKLEKTKKLINSKYAEFEKITNDLLAIENNIKAGELTKKHSFKRTTAKALQAANRLSRMQEQLRKEIQELEAEQEELETLQSYVADMAQNIDELPTDSKDFIEELREQVKDLESLQLSTGIQINAISKLIDQTEGALNKAIEFVKELISKFEKTYPNTPAVIVGQQWVDFLQANPNFLKINTNFKEDLAMVEDLVAQVEDLDIIPGERTVSELREELSQILKQLNNLETEIKTKSVILNKFQSVADAYKREQEQKKALAKNEELLKKFLGSADNSLATREYDNTYEADPKKDSVHIPTSTSAPSKKFAKGPLADHHVRANAFGARMNSFSNASNIRGVIITKNNEDKLIPGLTQYLKDQGDVTKKVDTSKTIALVMVDETMTPLDVNGQKIVKGETESQEAFDDRLLKTAIYQTFPLETLTWSNGDSMFRETTSDETKEAFKKQYAEWRTEQLANTELIAQNIEASFGVPEYVEYTDENGKKKRDFFAKTSVQQAGLIDDAQLTEEPVLVVPTIDAPLTKGSTSFKNPIGRVFLSLSNAYVKLQNRKLTSQEAENIYQAISFIANDLFENNEASETSQRLFNWLKTVVYWGTPKDAEGKPKDAGYNSVWFDRDSESGIFKLYISAKGQSFDFSPLSIKDNKGDIIALLSKMYNNVNATRVNGNNYNERYEEILSISDKGEIVKRDWPNYQSFLLASKTPEGKTRDPKEIPLSTQIKPLTSATDVNREGVYFTLKDKKAGYVPITPAKKVAAQTATTSTPGTAPVATTYVTDGKTVNTIKTPGGPVNFLVSPTGEVNLVDDAPTNDAIENIAKESSISINTSVNRIIASIENKIKEDSKKPQAPAPVTPAPSAPIVAPTTIFVVDGKTANTINIPNIGAIDFKVGVDGVAEILNTDNTKAVIEKLSKEKGWTENYTINVLNGSVSKAPTVVESVKKTNEASGGGFQMEITLGGEETPVATTPVTPKPAPVTPTAIGTPTPEDYDLGDLNDVEDPGKAFRVALKNELNQFEGENWDKVEKFLKKNFPLIPVYRVKNILQATNGVQAWGMLQDGAIYIYENAEVGTAYHEIFEAVWRMFSSPEEQVKIIDEFRNRQGSFTDRPTGKTVKYSNATAQQIKEQLAEEFRDYVQEGKIPAKPKDGRPYIVKLFSDLVSFIKEFFTGKNSRSNTEQLFRNIAKGYYKKNSPYTSALSYANKGIIDIDSVEVKDDSDFRIATLTQQEVHDMMEEMTYQTLGNLLSDNKGLFILPTIKKSEIYAGLREQLKDVVRRKAKIVDMDRKSANPTYSPQQINDVFANASRLYKSIQDDEIWSRLIDKHEEYLKKYNIEFDENDATTLSDENNTGGKSDFQDAQKIDQFKKANSAIKLLLSTVPIVDKEGNIAPSSINGARLLPTSEVYGKIRNLVHTSLNIDDMIERVRQLALRDRNYAVIYDRITKGDYKTGGGIDINKIENDHDERLINAFWKTFKLSNPEVLNLYILENGEVQIGDSSLATAARQIKEKMVSSMIEVFKTLNNKYFTYSEQDKRYNANQSYINSIKVGTVDSNIIFLKTLGIDFSKQDLIELFSRLPKMEKRFDDATKGLWESLRKTTYVGTINAKTININARLLELAEVEAAIKNPEPSSTFYGVNREMKQTYIGTNVASDFYDFISQLPSFTDAALEGTRFKYLKTDPFAKYSVKLKRMFSERGVRNANTEWMMKSTIADGTDNETKGKRKESSKLTYRDRLIQEINFNLEGIYLNLVPGDASIEWMMNMGNEISESELLSGYDVVNNIFRGYLLAELELSRDNRKYLKKGANSKDLRFFKAILEDKSELQDAKRNKLHNDIINEKGSVEEVYAKYANQINKKLKEFIDNESSKLKTSLMQYDVLEMNEHGNWDVDNIKIKQGEEGITDTDLNRNLNTLTVNFMINNIELHKLLYSDPYQYSDELKRIKNFLSPRQSIISSSKSMNAVMNKVRNKGFAKNDIGRTDFTKDYFKTATLQDISAVHDLPGYEEDPYDEADGQAIISFKGVRNFRIRASDWNTDEERQYRYDIAWEKEYKAKELAKTLTGSKLTKELEKRGLTLSEEEQELLDAGNPEVRSAYTAKKPIVAGVKLDANGNPMDYNASLLDKFSFYPLSFRIAATLSPESNLVKLYNKMQSEDIDYVIFKSGRKVGAEKENVPYNPSTGELNETPFEENINVPFSIISIQSEVPSKDDEAGVTRGSQVTKEVTMDFMEAGVPIDFDSSNKNFNKRYEAWFKASENWDDLSEEEQTRLSPLYKEIRNNQKLLVQMTNLGYNELLKTLDIKQTPDGYRIENIEKTYKTLRNELLKREMNDNISEALLGFKNGEVVLEATPAFQQIKNILYSIADREAISPKITGGMKVQISSAFFEDNKVKAKKINGKDVYTSDILRFYENEDGKRTCELMLSRWFDSPMTDDELIEYLNKTDEGQKILAGFAFRIPSQVQNSIDCFVIKKFLPREFGDNVVVPSALVKKAGSDFDIDKLSIYLKNVISNAFTKAPKLIEFLTDKNSTAEERYVHWVRENSNRDTRKYVRFLSRDAVKNLKSNFEIEAAKIKAKFQEIRKDNVEDLFDDMQSDIQAKKSVQLAAQESYMEELFDMGKKVFWRMTDATRDSFWAVRDDIRRRGVKGPDEIRRYLALSAGLIQDPTTIESDVAKLEGLVKIYSEELRVMGIMGDTIDKIVKDAIADFRDNKNTLNYALKLDKISEFETLGDIYEDAKLEESFEASKEIADIDGLTSFDDFKKLTAYEQNVKKALQNAYIDSSINLASSKENFDKLIRPNSAEQLKDITNKILDKLGVEKFDYSSPGSMISRDFMTRLRHAFVTGKYAIGIAAVQQTNHSLNQRQPMYIDPSRRNLLSKIDQTWIGDAQINFVKKNGAKNYNTMIIDGKEVASLSMIRNQERSKKYPMGQYISDIISQFIDGYVDIAKGPWIMQLGANPNVASTFMFLAKIGVPIEEVCYFMNQPIVRDYLRTVENAGYSWLFIDQFVNGIKDDPKYKVSEEKAKAITSIPTDLYETIGVEKLTDDQKAEQQFILDEFLKYAKMASQLFNVTQGSNWDTANFNDPYLVYKKEQQLIKAQNTIISSVDELLENSFLGNLREVINKIRDSFSSILKSESPRVREVVEKVLKPHTEMSDRDFVNVAQRAVMNLLDWAVQIDGNNTKTGDQLNLFIKRALLDKGGYVKQVGDFIKTAKDDITHPMHNNYIVKILEPVYSGKEQGTNNLTLTNKDNKVYDQNKIIYGFEELREYLSNNRSDLYKKLVAVSILQSGISRSKVSFTNLLPYEDFKDVYNKTLFNLDKFPNLEEFYNLNVFERNNWSDSDIVPFKKAIWLKGKKNEKRRFYNPNMTFFLPQQLQDQVAQKNLPPMLSISTLSREGAADIIVYSWEKGEELLTENEMNLSKSEQRAVIKERKKEMRRRGDYSFIQKGLFKKVYQDNSVDPSIYTSFGDDGRKFESYIYKAINAWGDSYKANEFYDEARPSQIDNGFIKVEFEAMDAAINPYIIDKEYVPPTKLILKNNLEYKASDINVPMLENMGYKPEEIADILEAMMTNKPIPEALRGVSAQVPVSGAKANIAMQDFNVKKIKAGTKTTTTRSDREFEKIGIPIGQSVTVNFGGQDFTVTNRGLLTIQEAGGKEAMLKSEGYATVDDMLYQQTKDWMGGKGKLYVYDIKPAQTSVSGPGPETKINIYAGTGENAELSNFANRPVSDPLGVEFRNVEAAFQYAKINYSTGDNSDIAMKLQTASGAEAKALGRNIKGLNTEAWDKNSSIIMKSIMKESFQKNPEALKKLLATGNATLTHTQDKGKWGTEFPKLLMEIRNELRPVQAPIATGDAASLKAQIAELEQKKKTKGLGPSDMATLAELETKLGKIQINKC